MIVCPQPQAAERGIQVLRHGGNAVDAAVVTAFLQGVVDPNNCGIGGFGQMHVYMSGTGEEKVFDFHGKAGSKVTPGMWEDLMTRQSARDGTVLKGHVNRDGYTSITVPGTVMGLYEAHARYGTMPWKETVRPAVELAGRGFVVSQEQAHNWKIQPDYFRPFLVTPEAMRIYTKNGAPYDEGEVISNKDYAETLRRIASEGVDTFYQGEIAAKIVDDFERNGAFITSSDLENYQVDVCAPIFSEYRGYTVASNNAPGGGPLLLELLNIIEGFDLTNYDWRVMGSNVAEYIHNIAMAMRAVEADKTKYMGDPDFVDVPTKAMVSKERAEEWRQKIRSNERILLPTWPGEPPSTTQLCVADEKGNAVSLTHTLGSSSGAITPGLGFFYNNAMGGFDPIPGRPNSIAPRKSRITAMSPSMVLKKGRPLIILGGLGGSKIVHQNLFTITNIVDHGMTPAEAVAHPRFYCLHSDIIDVEARIPQYVCEQLEAKGNLIVKAPASYAFAALMSAQVITIDHENGKVLGGSDPRTGGIVLST